MKTLKFLTAASLVASFAYAADAAAPAEVTKAAEPAEAPAAEKPSRTAVIYDMNGRQLNAKPDNGIYIQNGQKRIAN